MFLIYNMVKQNLTEKPSLDKVQDDHLCIYDTLKSFLRVHRRGGMIATLKLFQKNGTVEQRTIVVKPWIHVISGDHVGHNILCGYFKSLLEGVIMPFCDCKHGFEDLDSSLFKCIEITPKGSMLITDDLEKLELYSQQNLLFNAFQNGTLSALIDTIFESEVLHVFGHGITPYTIEIISNIIGDGNNVNTFEETELDNIVYYIQELATSQSDRSFPRHSEWNGGLDNTKSTAKENTGNLFIILLVLLTLEGNNIFEHNYMIYEVNPYPIMKNLFDTLKIYLSCEKLIHENHWKVEI